MSGLRGAPPSNVDVLIAGAGPAGLMAALGIAEMTSLSILVIDAGPSVECRHRNRPRDLVSGVGGAGLFSDGKLCLSLDVGGELPQLLDRPHRNDLLGAVISALGVRSTQEALAPQPRFSSESMLTEEQRVLQYRVQHIGTEHCAEVIKHLIARLVRLGVRFLVNTKLDSLSLSPRYGYRALLRESGNDFPVDARRVVLALGKVGAHDQDRLTRCLGVASNHQPLYVGLRLELMRQIAERLFVPGSDTKLKLSFADGSKIKTHCVAAGGAILPLEYDGLHMAGGHSALVEKTDKTSVGILWNGLKFGGSGREMARSIMARAPQGREAVVCQRLSDYLDNRASSLSSILELQPSTDKIATGNLREILPVPFFKRFGSFLQYLESIDSGLLRGDALLFGPSLEWWASRTLVDDGFQTSALGLYSAGDGAGWSQGIVHASAVGLRVAEAISNTRIRASDLSRAWVECLQDSRADSFV